MSPRGAIVMLAGLLSLTMVGIALFGPIPAPRAWEGDTGADAHGKAAGDARAEAPGTSEPPETPAFRRGINLSRPLSFAMRDPGRPGKYAWPPFQSELASMTDAEIARLRRLGFDFVRLPVDPGPFLEASDERARELFDLLRYWVSRLQAHGLAVMLDIHPATYASNWRPEDILADPSGPRFSRYEEFLRKIASLFRDEPATGFALELMNEPQPACRRKWGEDWTVSQKRLFEAVRSVAPAMPVVLIGGCWASPSGLLLLDPSSYDDATLFDVHFYEPYHFTHQSIPWASVPARYLAGLSYPAARGSLEETMRQTTSHLDRMRENGTPPPADALAAAEREARSYYGRRQPGPDTIAARFDAMADWAEEHGVAPGRIVVGEFSAIRWPDGIEDDGSRSRWLEDVRKAAEERGFGWALWDYSVGFGLLEDTAARAIDRDAAKALGLDLDASSP